MIVVIVGASGVTVGAPGAAVSGLPAVTVTITGSAVIVIVGMATSVSPGWAVTVMTCGGAVIVEIIVSVWVSVVAVAVGGVCVSTADVTSSPALVVTVT